MILPKEVHSSWDSFITEEILAELKVIENEIGNNFNPSDPDKLLRFLSVDVDNVKVIWLGQDVYPAKGVATGRSFEVGGLNDWLEPFRQVSLKNIVRLIYKNYTGISDYKDIKKFSEIQKEIKNGSFQIKPPNNIFDSLENQGVLFLNTSFTCEVGEANSHKIIWRAFSKKVLNYISTKNPDIKWFLWGKEAISTKEDIPEGVFFESRHPMMCSEKYQDDFLKFDGFKATMSEINWLG
ncbi:uracil-DNA glycosylase [Sporosarcina sp. 6E9]|uniref:uracil-DNA glycosylase n=1 Tax=Sporosarcina sp. 6E9 TaxID=2819235 RepID=UPI001B31496F|nr:uracil-DNA glycosylase [Sporosarcina sp. 6E9]